MWGEKITLILDWFTCIYAACEKHETDCSSGFTLYSFKNNKKLSSRCTQHFEASWVQNPPAAFKMLPAKHLGSYECIYQAHSYDTRSVANDDVQIIEVAA